jgi:hypothetical protein
MRISRRRCNAVFLLLVTVILIWQLFLPPALSVADTNDFQKLVGRYCLASNPGSAPDLFDFTVLRWHFSPAACVHWPFETTARGALLVALGLNRLFTSTTSFDLRWMGAVYLLLFIAGFYYLQRALSPFPLIVSACIQTCYILAVCNAVYVPWLNTFYFDAIALASRTVAIAGVALIALPDAVHFRTMLATAIWLAIMAGSKSQHAPAALGLAIVFLAPFGPARISRHFRARFIHGAGSRWGSAFNTQ